MSYKDVSGWERFQELDEHGRPVREHDVPQLRGKYRVNGHTYEWVRR